MSIIEKVLIKLAYFIARFSIVFIVIVLVGIVGQMDYEDHKDAKGCTHRYCD